MLPVALLAVVVAAGVAALLVDDDAVDTALGAVAGAGTVLLLLVVLLQVLGARAERRARDRTALDGLEPLRAARRDSRGPVPRPVPGDDVRAPAPTSRVTGDDLA